MRRIVIASLTLFVYCSVAYGGPAAKPVESTGITKETVRNVPEEKLFPLLGPARSEKDRYLYGMFFMGVGEHDRRIILDEIYSRYPDWSEKVKSTIEIRGIRTGMTDKQVLASWGNPETNNRSVGSWGVHEQWVYDKKYLYFENGLLTSFQDSK